MKRESWIVKKDGRTDSGDCFYCKAQLGTEHNAGCVLRKRTVIVDVTLRVIADVPEDWDEGTIEYGALGRGGCVDNVINELTAQLARWEALKEANNGEKSRCFCLWGDDEEVKFVREATAEDEDHFCLSVNDLDEDEK